MNNSSFDTEFFLKQELNSTFLVGAKMKTKKYHSLISLPVLIILFLILFMALPAYSNKPSFDCSKATTKIEKMICSDPILSKIDLELSEAYSNLFKKLGQIDENLIKTTQRKWLADRDMSCREKSIDLGRKCLEDQYKIRIKELNDYEVFVEANNKAIKFYSELNKMDREPHRNYKGMHKALDILNGSNINTILWNKPEPVSDQFYVAILNNYASLILDSIKGSYKKDPILLDKVIKLLKRILTISPNHKVACLNIGDALNCKLSFASSFNEKLYISEEISHYYKKFERLTELNINRIKQFQSAVISQKESDNICDYVLKYSNNGNFQQIISRPLQCDLKWTPCQDRFS